jgi:hypothetical protein
MNGSVSSSSKLSKAARPAGSVALLKSELRALYDSYRDNSLTPEEESLFKTLLVRAGYSPLAVRVEYQTNLVDTLTALKITPREVYQLREASPIATR